MRRTTVLAAFTLVLAIAAPIEAAAASPRVAAQAATQAPASAVALAADPGGFDHAFYRGTDDAVYHRTYRDGTWGAQSPIGGRIAGAPGAARAGTALYVAGKGGDGALWLRVQRGGTWGAWQSLGGAISSAPALAGGADGRVDAFARGGDGRLWTRTLPAGSTTWTPWATLGGDLASGPAAVSRGTGRPAVYATFPDRTVRWRGLDGTTWSPWVSLGGGTYTAPAVAWDAGAGVASVFVRGTNDALYVRRGTGAWATLGGGLIDAPGATATGAGGIDVVGRGTDAALWSRRLRSGTWTPWGRGWSPAAPGPPAPGLLGTDWTRIPTTAPVVALTFDAGGNANGLSSILATLQRENVAASFYLTGSFARAFPAQSNAVAIGGYPIGNHSDTHPHMPTLTDAQVRAELTAAHQSILRTTGAESRPLFRFPFGEVDARVLGLVNGGGYAAVRWTVDTLGWQGTSGGMTAQRVVDRAVGALQPGEIVLMHVGAHPEDGSTLDADALPGIIDAVRARGYRFVTLDALTG
jgi:peptidoglycan/xylan/chitin deacetylase (PgdA/CDA1 family)